MHVAQMNFHHGERSNAADGIAQGYGSVGVGSGVEHNPLHIACKIGRLQCVDERTLVVRLLVNDFYATLVHLLKLGDDVVECGRTVDARFAAPEKIEVRTIENEDLHAAHYCCFVLLLRGVLSRIAKSVMAPTEEWRICCTFVLQIYKFALVLQSLRAHLSHELLLMSSFASDRHKSSATPHPSSAPEAPSGAEEHAERSAAPSRFSPDVETLVEKYRLYLLLEQGLSENTREAYERDVQRFLEFLTEIHVDVLAVNLEVLHRYTQHLFDLGAAARSMARMLSGVRSFYRFLQLDGHIPQDPTELLESPRIGKHLPAVLSVEEVEAILAAIDQSKPEGQRDHCLIEVLYSCGLRVSEVCNLKLSDLFFDEGFIRVTGKGDKQRIVPISPRAIHELNNWFHARGNIAVKPEDEDFVFVSPSRGRHLSRITVFHNIKVYTAAAGIEKTVSPHTFRHTFATHLLEGGASLRAIQVMLGHENIGTTEIYTHLDSRFLRQQVLDHFPRNKKLRENKED